MFSIPLAVFTGIFVLISYLTTFNNVIIWGLGIIPTMPFLAGLVMVIRKYALEKKDVPVVSTFFTAVKDNLKHFLLHGIATYAIVACSFFAILYYYSLAQYDAVFGAVLTLYMIFTALLIVMMFYVPLMTITYDLKLKDIYKNSFLLIFGKILRNLVAFVLLAIVTAVFVLLVTFSSGVWFIVSVAVTVALYPLIACYIINSVISKGLQENVGQFVETEYTKIQRAADILHEQEAVAKVDSESDYVFVNGRMVKNNSKSENKE